MIYVDYEYDLYKNMFNLDFLTKCHSNLFHYLNQRFETKNSVSVLLYQMNTTMFGKIGIIIVSRY